MNTTLQQYATENSIFARFLSWLGNLSYHNIAKDPLVVVWSKYFSKKDLVFEF